MRSCSVTAGTSLQCTIVRLSYQWAALIHSAGYSLIRWISGIGSSGAPAAAQCSACRASPITCKTGAIQRSRSRRCAMANPLISIVTGTYNRLDSLQRMIKSVRSQMPRHIAYELVIVDGGSTDGTLAWCEAQAD